jgi:cytochrome P450
MLKQTTLMVKLAKRARGFGLGEMPWHKISVIRNNRLMLDFFMPLIESSSTSLSRKTSQKTIINSALTDVLETDGNITPLELNPDFVKDLVSNLKNFVFAGHDTTTTTICWIFKNLQDNPDTLAKLRAEHDKFFGTDLTTVADQVRQAAHKLYNLPYTLGVIKETLRLTPVAATLREGQPGFYLSNPGDSLKYRTEGFAIWDAMPMLHRRADLWPQPNKFLPERWFAPEGDPLRPHKDAWRAFELGSRNCIGQELALIELKIVVVLVARRFDIAEAWDKMDIEK